MSQPTATSNDAKMVRVWVLCSDENSAPSLLSFDIDCSRSRHEQGDPYELATEKAVKQGYTNCHAFDQNDPAGRHMLMLEAQVALLQGHVLQLRVAAANVVEWNRQTAKDRYGDADKAESWSCVRELRDALAATRPSVPGADADTASWVIREKGAGGRVIVETFDRAKVEALNTAKYEAVPIQEYLGEINRRIREAKTAGVDGVAEHEVEAPRHSAPRDR